MIFKIISAVVFWLVISFLFSLPCLSSWCGRRIISAKGDAKDIEKVILREFDDEPFTFLIFFLESPILFVIIFVRFLSSKLISFVSMSLYLIITNIHNDNGGAV